MFRERLLVYRAEHEEMANPQDKRKPLPGIGAGSGVKERLEFERDQWPGETWNMIVPPNSLVRVMNHVRC
ncbi:MAG: hypothetical protein JWL75_4 [Parcubacteria group bacterium]|nr:hypothetical protein [Parcubacteria group bacterium]